MDVKTYNTEVYPKINHARSFLYCLDHALQKSGEEAQKQVSIIGWNDELKQFMRKAIEYYADYLRSQLETSI